MPTFRLHAATLLILPRCRHAIDARAVTRAMPRYIQDIDYAITRYMPAARALYIARADADITWSAHTLIDAAARARHAAALPLMMSQLLPRHHITLHAS